MPALVTRVDRGTGPRTRLVRERARSPEAGPHDVVILVMAAGVSRAGVVASGRSPSRVPGSDASGVVWSTGSAVSRWRVGDEVLVHGTVTCGACPACTGFDRAACERQRVWGLDTEEGACALFARARADQLLRKPKHMTWEQAASFGLPYFCAYHALVDRAKVRPGEQVLVWGAGGPLGVYAIQLARLLGATAVGIAASDARTCAAAYAGASGVVDRRKRPHDKLVRALRDQLGERGADVVLDPVATSTLAIGLEVAARRGRVVVASPGAGEVALDPAALWTAERQLIAAHLASPEECQRAFELAAQGKILPALVDVVAFDALPSAHQKKHDGRDAAAVVGLVGSPRPGLRTLAEATGER